MLIQSYVTLFNLQYENQSVQVLHSHYNTHITWAVQQENPFFFFKLGVKIIHDRLCIKCLGWRQKQNVECASALFEPTDGEDQTRSTATSSDCAHSHTHLCGITVVRGYKSVRLYSFVKFWHGRDRKRQMTGDSYMLLTICSLSPFLKVRSDAVRDS